MMDVDRIAQVMQATGDPHLPASTFEHHAPALWPAMQETEITTPLRVAAFLAQLAHETGGWRWLKELGGPSYFTRYDGRRDLGNTQPGDGYRYRGRGYIQITGRANYRHYGEVLGIALETQPELAQVPMIAAAIATRFWTDHGLNRLADQGDLIAITRTINGGLSGQDDRAERYALAKKILFSAGETHGHQLA